MRLSWSTEHGEPLVTFGFTRDTSRGGMRIESDRPIPARTTVSFRAVDGSLHGSGTVRYCRHSAMKYVIGLELRTRVG